MANTLFRRKRVDSEPKIQIAYRSTQVITFAFVCSTTAAALARDLIFSPHLKSCRDPLSSLFDLAVVVVSYLGLITAMRSLSARLCSHTLHRQAALICSDGSRYDRYLDIAYISFVTWLICGLNIRITTTTPMPELEGFFPYLGTASLLFLTSLISAVIVTQPILTKSQVSRLCDRLSGELAGISGVDMKQANKLLTLLVLQGKYKEADELSQKLISLAEQSPELIR